MKISIVIPTYNEEGNIGRLIKRINQIAIKNALDFEIIIIDDKSVDGTVDEIRELQRSQNNIKLIIRKALLGIGTAHIRGYNSAKGDIIISMDADLSHPPEKIPEFLDKIRHGYDMVMSSRYIPGGKTDKNLKFYLISKLGGYYLSKLFRINILDFSTGYRAFRKEYWKKVKNFPYSKRNTFLIESVYFAHKFGARMTEVPIFFKEREIGKSKTRLLSEAIKALSLPLKLRIMWLKKKKSIN